MELSYWESRWKKDKTGFHMPGGYPGLQKHWHSLELPPKPNVCVPLCGKSADMIFLEDRGANVTGVEISEKAVRSFFSENQREFDTDSYADFTIYSSGKIRIWQGDFLKFPQAKADFDLIYDKAALVALPPEKRAPYAAKLLKLSGSRTQILLHQFIYPQEEMHGPPFSVDADEVENFFAEKFASDLLEKNQIPSVDFPPFRRRGLKSPITEQLILLKPR